MRLNILNSENLNYSIYSNVMTGHLVIWVIAVALNYTIWINYILSSFRQVKFILRYLQATDILPTRGNSSQLKINKGQKHLKLSNLDLIQVIIFFLFITYCYTSYFLSNYYFLFSLSKQVISLEWLETSFFKH